MAHMDETERIARLEQVVIPQAHHEILGRCAESHLDSFVPSGVQRAAHGAGVESLSRAVELDKGVARASCPN
jgi:hypothetical protein